MMEDGNDGSDQNIDAHDTHRAELVYQHGHIENNKAYSGGNKNLGSSDCHTHRRRHSILVPNKKGKP